MLNANERAVLNDWVRAVAPRAIAYARSLLGRSSADPEDVVQEAFLRVLRHARDYDLPNDGVKILFRTVSNLCINASVRARNMASLETGGPEDGPMAVADESLPLPEEIVAGRELEARLNRAMAGLPELQRAALELRALGQGKQAIAEILEITESHAGVLVHRARQTLAGLLASDLKEQE
ncbi:RNA polymerase sigma factor [Zavarzinella formosa]|uniref:RNA polymerase sigma factor n=1 Tax=Zavarzinella formosa TaxID=360055 RepID=UPI0002D6D7A7|nr:sigma-70 family RNA polymerase sigma factor [Zavarzinella formosa]